MRGLLLVGALGATGCQLLFPLDGGQPDPGPPAACSTKATALSDDLTGPSLAPGWTFIRNPNNPALITQTNDGLQFVFNGIQGYQEVAYDVGFDLRDSRFAVAVEIAGVLPSPSSHVDFELRNVEGGGDPLDGVAWRIDGTGLVAGKILGGTFGALGAPIPYDPVAHRFLSFSQTDGTTSWSVSPDGITFEPQTETTTVTAHYFRPALAVNDADGGGTVFGATFRDLNTTLTPTDVCEVAVVRDAFDADDTITWGHRPNTSCQASIIGGQLELASSDTAFECVYATSGIYNAIDSQLVIEGTDFTSSATLPPGASIIAQLTTLDGSAAWFEVTTDGDNLVGQVQIGSDGDLMTIPGGQAPYDPAVHRYWRLSGELDLQGAQKLLWEVSGDGLTFEPFGEFGNLTGFERARVRLGMFGAPAGARARFESVGLP